MSIDTPAGRRRSTFSGLAGKAVDRAGKAVERALPARLRNRLMLHRELVKFLIVGGTCWTITVVITYALKFTILSNKPVTALTIATIAATFVSYLFNREWSFRTRGGRARHHEALLFFTISGIGVAINSAPLWVSRYVLHLRVPHVSGLVQELSDFTSGIIIGTLLAMVFRLWAFKKFVFPHQDARDPHQDARDRA